MTEYHSQPDDIRLLKVVLNIMLNCVHIKLPLTADDLRSELYIKYCIYLRATVKHWSKKYSVSLEMWVTGSMK